MRRDGVSVSISAVSSANVGAAAAHHAAAAGQTGTEVPADRHQLVETHLLSALSVMHDINGSHISTRSQLCRQEKQQFDKTFD